MSNESTKLLDDLLGRKLVIQRGARYYLSAGDGKKMGDSLGSGKVASNQKLVEMVQNGELKSIEELVASAQPSETGSNTLTSTLADANAESLSQTKINEDMPETNSDLLAEVMGSIQELKPDLAGSMQGIYIEGVDIRDETNPVIQRFLFHPRWRDRGNLIKNGKSFMNKGYTVFLKEWEYFKISPNCLTTNRDDSPEEPYITSGLNVLCIVKKADFKERKEAQRQRNTDYANSMSDERQERAARLADEKDPRVVQQILENDNNLQMDAMAKNMDQSGKSKDDIDATIARFKSDMPSDSVSDF